MKAVVAQEIVLGKNVGNDVQTLWRVAVLDVVIEEIVLGKIVGNDVQPLVRVEVAVTEETVE